MSLTTPFSLKYFFKAAFLSLLLKCPVTLKIDICVNRPLLLPCELIGTDCGKGSKCKLCSGAGDSLRLEDGQAVQLEDGTTAFIHHTSKGTIAL